MPRGPEGEEARPADVIGAAILVGRIAAPSGPSNDRRGKRRERGLETEGTMKEAAN
jgi:hypothetical protein